MPDLPTAQRQLQLAKDMRDALTPQVLDVPAALKLIRELSENDALIAELMAVAARPGTSEQPDTALEYCDRFHDPDSNFTMGPCWFHAGEDDLPITHHLPEPNDPR